MSAYRRGDVVLVPIDFTDRSGAKLRPAAVVSSEEYNRNGPDVVIASITSNLSAIPHPGDHRIQKWREAGLLKPSLVQTKISTVEIHLIRRKLGEMDGEDMAALDAGLREALGI